MSVRINREEFLTALESVSPGLSPKDVLEQSSCFVFSKGRVMTYNDDVGCTAPFKLNGLTGAVQGQKLLSVLKMMPEDEVTLDEEEGRLVISGIGQKVGVAMESEILLPIASMERPPKESWSEVPETYSEALLLVQECAGKDAEKSFTTACVHFTPKYIEAMDNKQLLRYRIKSGVTANTLVKRDSVKFVAVAGVSKVAETPSWLHFRNDAGLVISCRRYVEEFLDLTSTLEVEGVPIVLPKGLIASSDMAELFSSDDADNNVCTVEIRPGKLRIKATGVTGFYSGYKEVNYTGAPMKFLIAPRLLKQIVTKHNEAVISPTRLMVDGGKWRYVAALGSVEEE